MANGDGNWHVGEWMTSIAATIATAAAGIVAWMFRRYGHDREMLLQHELELQNVALDSTVNARFSEFSNDIYDIKEHQSKADKTLSQISETVQVIRRDMVSHKKDIEWIRDAMEEDRR